MVLIAACSSPTVWEGPQGQVTEEPGSSHCDEDGVSFLRLNEGRFASDPQNSLYDQGAVETAFEPDATLPPDVVDTLLRDGDRHVWVAVAATEIFVVDGDTVELWPRVSENYGCD